MSLQAPAGQIYGLLGPNGAGKTTALRCVATLLKPDAGHISVLGLDVLTHAKQVRSRVGLLTSDMKLSGNLTPRELLRFFGELNHLGKPVIARRIDELAVEFGLAGFLDLQVEKCSTGQKQRAALAVSLIHDPDVILFDEPTNGLDLFAAKTVVDFLRAFKARGKTVLLSTHVMSEAETLCDRVGILLEGHLAAEGTVAELQARTATTSLDAAFFAIAAQQGVSHVE
ncbi:MAG: ABC transporter ATP-binding protein [Spirochaetales bacterium]